MTSVRAKVGPEDLVRQLLLDGDRRIRRQAFGDEASPAVGVLIDGGLLVRDGIVDSVVCDACGVAHFADVVPEGPHGALGWHCPDTGFVIADNAILEAVTFSVERCLQLVRSALSEVYGPPRGRIRQLPGTETWTLGTWQVAGSMTTVVISRDPDTQSAALRRATSIASLPKYDVGIMLVLEEGMIDNSMEFLVLPIGHCISVDTLGRISIVDELFVRAVAGRAKRPGIASTGRPNLRAEVFSVITRLVASGVPVGAINAGMVRRSWSEELSTTCPAPSTLRKHVSGWKSQNL
jgi:hypothetical protein